MTLHSVCFDDPDDDDLFVFSGSDLLISHYDIADLDWREVAERSALDARRGLVIAQVAVLEDFVDEFILYLADPSDPDELSARLDRQTIGPRLDRLEALLGGGGLFDERVSKVLADLRMVVARRNELAHGTLHLRPVGPGVPRLEDRDRELEWVLANRRSRTTQRITTLMLREDLYEAIGIFTTMLSYAETFVEQAPRPVHFVGGHYLGAPTP